jgi:hypothetical protein
MILKRVTIHGRKGETVCYSLPNFRYDGIDKKIKWDAFRFYTPLGQIADNEGFRFFNVIGKQILMQRDKSFNKELFVKITQERGIEVFEVPEGTETNSFATGLEGDIVVTAFIPTNPIDEITVEYKDVIDG